MGRGQRSWKQKQADKARNTKRNKLKRSQQFFKKSYKLENNISKFVKNQKIVPETIQKEAKFRVKNAKKKNEILPGEKQKTYGIKGSYMACLAGSTDESFYFIHKEKNKHLNSQVIKSDARTQFAEFAEPKDWGAFGPPEKPNTCTALVPYEPKTAPGKHALDPFYNICYHKEIAFKCKYANRNVNMQIEYNKNF